MTTFERIKKLAKKKDKNLQQVARELNYGENYFYSLNAGKQPTAEKLQEIADYFDVSIDYLLGRTDNPLSASTSNESIQSSARQIMMRMDTNGLSEEDFAEVEKEMERFLKWRIEEIKREKDGEVR